MTVEVDMKALLEAGAHFGHKTSRWHPKMAPYIHSKRQDAHIINLEKTVEGLEAALAKTTELAKNGKKILFVGTKKQMKEAEKSIKSAVAKLNKIILYSEEFYSSLCKICKELDNHLEKCKEIINIPVTKYPIKSEKFTEKQIEIMKTQLAIEAKCKKYSMTLENIYDKMPMGLYSDITINKDTTITCKYENNPTIGENQILVTGKRKYDTQITKRLIKYSELGL